MVGKCIEPIKEKINEFFVWDTLFLDIDIIKNINKSFSESLLPTLFEKYVNGYKEYYSADSDCLNNDIENKVISCRKGRLYRHDLMEHGEKVSDSIFL